MADIQVGLVGFGMAGRVFHAPVIDAVSGLRLAAIVQRTGDTAGAAFPAARVVRSLDELLALQDVRLVVIATPNRSHAELALRCVSAGRHVVIDKPFAPSSAEAEPVIDAAERAGVVLSVFHNRRFDGDFLTVQRLHREDACGRTVELESCFDRYRAELKPPAKPGAWKERAEPGAGLLFDIGPHLVDQALTLFGLPEAVTGNVRIERDGAVVDDAFDVGLHYAHTRALLRATMLACEPRPRFVLRGTGGTFVKRGLDPQEERLSRGERPGAESWGRERRERWGTLTTPGEAGVALEAVETEAGDYRRYYENVRDAILGRTALAVTAQQALDVIRLLELARESSRLRRTLEVK